MGMRINTNVASLTAQRYLESNNASLSDSLERLSSGFRINKSADDAAGLAVSEGIRAKVRGLGVAKRNANDGISMIQIAEGSMNEMSNILIRLRELTVQSASDTIGSVERGYLNREYTQLVDEIDRIAKTTEYNSLKLFDTGDQTSFVIQVGTSGSAPEENRDTISINLEGLKFSSEDLGLGKENEIGPIDGGDSPTRDEIAQKLGTIDSALDRFASERATLGSVQSRLTSSLNNLGVSVENLETAKSRIKDVDFAAESTRLAQAQVLKASSTSVLAQANQAPEMALQLLR
ncbi:MAG: flagellin [Oligoflexales bacterium]